MLVGDVMDDKKEIRENVNKQVEEKINSILKDGVKQANVDYLYKLVDIHKDLANEEYWEEQKEDVSMRYRSYGRENYNEGGNYGRRGRDSRGRYREGGSYNEGNYGRRGNYRGHEMIDEMQEHYGNYSEGREEYSRGNYGAKQDTLKSLEYMLESVVDFIEMLKHDASSQEEVQMIKEYTKQISEL